MRIHCVPDGGHRGHAPRDSTCTPRGRCVIVPRTRSRRSRRAPTRYSEGGVHASAYCTFGYCAADRTMKAMLYICAAVVLAAMTYAQTPSTSTTLPERAGQPSPATTPPTETGKEPLQEAVCRARVDVLSGHSKDRKL